MNPHTHQAHKTLIPAVYIYIGKDDTSNNLTIEGNGTLNATGGIAKYSNGIEANYITIKGGTVNATSGELPNGLSYGILANQSITIEDGTVNTTAGEVQGGSSYGIFAVYDCKIEGGTVNATGRKSQTGSSYGISASNGEFKVEGGAVIATSGEAYISSRGIYTDKDLTISGGVVEAQGNKQALHTENGTVITPPAGQQLSAITATDGSNPIALNGSGNTRTFTMPAADVIVNATFANISDPEPEPEPEITMEVQPDGLTVRVSNTGQITLRLTDNNSDAFILATQTIDNIAPGEHADITLKMTEGLEEGIYTTVLRASGYNVWEQLHITYTVTTPVANEQVEANALRAYAQDGTLHLTGLTPGDQWRLYTITGALTKTAIAEGEETTTALPARGIYIIATNKGTMKVIW